MQTRIGFRNGHDNADRKHKGPLLVERPFGFDSQNGPFENLRDPFGGYLIMLNRCTVR